MTETTPPPVPPFWREKTLAEMSEAEWESLCDGCGRCCLVVLEDDDDGADAESSFLETSVCCQLFDPVKRRCRDYANRSVRVPGCVQVTPEIAGELSWMPQTCAYRRLAEGHDLADWHPLVSGRADSVVEAGIAVAKSLTSETRVRTKSLWKYVTGPRR